jgi:predicted nicotinamide N-methyase
MVLILFTPERAATEQIAFSSELGVPDIAFQLADITERFPPDVTYSIQRISSDTLYGAETILFLERDQADH